MPANSRWDLIRRLRVKNVVSIFVRFLCDGKAHFLCGATAKPGSRPRLCWGFCITHLDTHTHTHTRLVGLLWTSDQLVAEATTYTTHNKYKWRNSMPPAGLEPAIRTIRPTQTCVLDRGHRDRLIVLFNCLYSITWMVLFWSQISQL